MEGRIDKNYYTGYLSGVADGLNQGRQDTIAELEKLKEELNTQGLGRCDGKIFDKEYNRIIDKHISELKGENK